MTLYFRQILENSVFEFEDTEFKKINEETAHIKDSEGIHTFEPNTCVTPINGKTRIKVPPYRRRFYDDNSSE